MSGKVESNFVGHIECSVCQSTDANSLYDDGHTFCFACATRATSVEKTVIKQAINKDLLLIDYRALESRRLTEESCRKWDYGVSSLGGEAVQVATYKDRAGASVAQKTRTKDKNFKLLGATKGLQLFGQNLWKTGGRRLVITEGEIDAISISQMQEHRWPVVSLPNGCQAAVKAIKEQLEFVESFHEVVLCFDSDEHGQKAAKEVADMLTPGKAFLVSMELKDANEYLKEGRIAEFIKLLFNAQIYRPDGIISGEDISLEDLMSTSAGGYSTGYPRLDEKLGKLRKAELTLLTAGSGIGKSTLAREIAYNLMHKQGLKIGNIFLEESVKKTAQGYIAIHNNVALGALRADASIISANAYSNTHKAVIANGRNFFFCHFGSLDSDNLLSKIKYLATGVGCDFIFLDHISIAISGNTASSEGERRDIDILMTNLRSIVEQTGVGIVAIIHLSKPDSGKSHEEGGRVTLTQLRGSGSLKQLSDNVVALERDQQSEEVSNDCTIRLLKNREHGDVGVCDTIRYSKETGRLLALTEGLSTPFDIGGDEKLAMSDADIIGF